MTAPRFQPIIGKNIIMRDIETSDAMFVLSLRNNERKGKHLNKTSGDVDAQIAYINKYKDMAQDYYFIIENKNYEPVGTVRIYDIRDGSFCWGSWLLADHAPISAGIESALLIYDFAFYILGFDHSHFDVRKENAKVIDFHKRMGAVIIDENDTDVFFNYDKKTYESIKPRYARYNRTLL